MITRAIRRKLTALAWLLAGTALPALAQTPSVHQGNTVAATDCGIDDEQLKPAVEAVVNADYPHRNARCKDLHTHPEPAFQETRTAARLAAEMRKLGFDVTEQIGRTGVAAIYRNEPGPTVLVRTELDALPMEEKTGVEAMSLTVMHTLQWNKAAGQSS